MGLVFQKCCAGVRGPPGAEIPLLGDAEDTWLSAVHRQRAPQDPRAWGPNFVEQRIQRSVPLSSAIFQAT